MQRLLTPLLIGIKIVFRVALVLLKHNEQKLLSMDFPSMIILLRLSTVIHQSISIELPVTRLCRATCHSPACSVACFVDSHLSSVIVFIISPIIYCVACSALMPPCCFGPLQT